MATRLTVFKFGDEYFANFSDDPGVLKLGSESTVIFILEEDITPHMSLARLAEKGKAEARRRKIDCVVGLDNVVFNLD